MAARKKKTNKKAGRRKKVVATEGKGRARPVFPYTTRPAGLRRFLQEVPNRPKPEAVNQDLLRGWELAGGDNYTIVRVLKAIGLVDSSNRPTEKYAEFMHAGTGPGVLGDLIKNAYAPLFQASHEPHRLDDSALRNLFNIHSSGAQKTMDYQIQTFKALCDYASFEGAAPAGTQAARSDVAQHGAQGKSALGASAIHIDLHIHLPENKTTREYEYIIQDIARYIYGRDDLGGRESDG